MPLKVWPNTALGCNHQSICMPLLQPLCSAALVPNVLPRRDEGSGQPCALSSKPYSILAPTQDSIRAAGFKIISGDHYTTTAHIIQVMLPFRRSSLEVSSRQDGLLPGVGRRKRDGPAEALRSVPGPADEVLLAAETTPSRAGYLPRQGRHVGPGRHHVADRQYHLQGVQQDRRRVSTRGRHRLGRKGLGRLLSDKQLAARSVGHVRADQQVPQIDNHEQEM